MLPFTYIPYIRTMTHRQCKATPFICLSGSYICVYRVVSCRIVSICGVAKPKSKLKTKQGDLKKVFLK